MAIGTIIGICCLFFTLFVVATHGGVITYNTVKKQKANKKNKGQDLEQRITSNIMKGLQEAGVIGKTLSNDVRKVNL